MTGGRSATADGPTRATYPELAGRRVIVTGGASGIGLATVIRFAAEGARVVALDRDEAGLRGISEIVRGAVERVRCDVSDPDDVAQAFDVIDDRLGGLDVLVANAGISIRHPFLEITPSDWRRTMAVNLDGVFYTAQAAAKRMAAALGGVILMTASTNGVVGHPLYAAYNASKAGVLLLMRSMALELAPAIRVNAVCPGYVMTPMQEAEYTPAMLAATNRKLPLQRHAQPEEVAALFAFLASDDARYLTGVAIPLDGGETAGGLASGDG